MDQMKKQMPVKLQNGYVTKTKEVNRKWVIENVILLTNYPFKIYKIYCIHKPVSHKTTESLNLESLMVIRL